jgi:hypothetical protein
MKPVSPAEGFFKAVYEGLQIINGFHHFRHTSALCGLPAVGVGEIIRYDNRPRPGVLDGQNIGVKRGI